MKIPTQTTSSLLFFLEVFLLVVSSCHAAKDNDYYYPDFVNPNTKYHMYWKDSINVLEDLDQFESLYIKYHGCVWSKYGTRYGTGEDYDEQGGDNDNDGFSNGCDGFGGGEYYWYMGRTQCFKANVAYSLYGVLKGDSPKKKRGTFCHADSFINSFFTTFGVESFAGPMGLGTGTANSVCLANGGGNGDGDGDGGDYSYAKVDDDYLGDDYVFYNAADFTSSGTGCSAKGQFVTDTYNGPFCQGANYESTSDTLDDFNARLEEMDCYEIFNSGGGGGGNGNDDGDGDNRQRRLDDGDYEFDYEFANMQAVNILAFSKSCSIAQYPKDCPDPFNKKRKYANNIQRALAYKTGNYRDMGENVMKAFSWIFFTVGLILMFAIYYLVQHQSKNGKSSSSSKSSRRKRQQRRRPSKTTEEQDDDDITSVGIESHISHSHSDSASKRSKGSTSSSKKSNRSLMRLPKLRLPKKFMGRGASGPPDCDIMIGGGGLDDTYSVETPLDEHQHQKQRQYYDGDGTAANPIQFVKSTGSSSSSTELADDDIYHDNHSTNNDQQAEGGGGGGSSTTTASTRSPERLLTKFLKNKRSADGNGATNEEDSPEDEEQFVGEGGGYVNMGDIVLDSYKKDATLIEEPISKEAPPSDGAALATAAAAGTVVAGTAIAAAASNKKGRGLFKSFLSGRSQSRGRSGGQASSSSQQPFQQGPPMMLEMSPTKSSESMQRSPSPSDRNLEDDQSLTTPLPPPPPENHFVLMSDTADAPVLVDESKDPVMIATTGHPFVPEKIIVPEEEEDAAANRNAPVPEDENRTSNMQTFTYSFNPNRDLVEAEPGSKQGGRGDKDDLASALVPENTVLGDFANPETNVGQSEEQPVEEFEKVWGNAEGGEEDDNEDEDDGGDDNEGDNDDDDDDGQNGQSQTSKQKKKKKRGSFFRRKKSSSTPAAAAAVVATGAAAATAVAATTAQREKSSRGLFSKSKLGLSPSTSFKKTATPPTSGGVPPLPISASTEEVPAAEATKSPKNRFFKKARQALSPNSSFKKTREPATTTKAPSTSALPPPPLVVVTPEATPEPPSVTGSFQPEDKIDDEESSTEPTMTAAGPTATTTLGKPRSLQKMFGKAFSRSFSAGAHGDNEAPLPVPFDEEERGEVESIMDDSMYSLTTGGGGGSFDLTRMIQIIEPDTASPPELVEESQNLNNSGTATGGTATTATRMAEV